VRSGALDERKYRVTKSGGRANGKGGEQGGVRKPGVGKGKYIKWLKKGYIG